MTVCSAASPDLLDQRGNEIFATAFGYLSQTKLSGEETFDDILKLLFNSPTPAAVARREPERDDGEIALRLGENEAFGLINVGDAANLCKLCEEHPDWMAVDDKEFSGSLFASLSDADSTVNVLIGSKKFTEGWNSWRVSTMGLMNVGKSEGSEIIQLFGRGVRLKGCGMCLKRSSQVDGIPKPPHIDLLETLNIFGIRAAIHAAVQGVPGGRRVARPTRSGKRLSCRSSRTSTMGATSIRLKEGVDFKRQGPKPTLEPLADRVVVTLNWYPKIQSTRSKEIQAVADPAEKQEGRLTRDHLAFLDWDAIYFELEQFKNEKIWHNLNLTRDAARQLLESPAWYRLLIPAQELEFSNFGRVRVWQESRSHC